MPMVEGASLRLSPFRPPFEVPLACAVGRGMCDPGGSSLAPVQLVSSVNDPGSGGGLASSDFSLQIEERRVGKECRL